MAFAYNPPSLRAAIEGEEEVTTRLEELQEGEEVDVENIIRFLRGIPADDMSKKRELAKFFQTESGQRYTESERKHSYDALLGEARNRQTIG
jgi:hypothetical protein